MTDSMPSGAKAEALFAALDPVKTITTIIEDRAWKDLGFNTFTEAWNVVHASGCNDRDEWDSPARDMTAAVRAHLAWQMLAEGTPPDDIADTLHTTPRLVEIWQREHAIGMKPEQAARVPRYDRSAV
jgi:hypothetical protein